MEEEDAETRRRGDAENREQKSEIRSQKSEEEHREQSRRDEMFIDKGNHQFSVAPLGAQGFRSSGASELTLHSGSINIKRLCGGTIDEVGCRVSGVGSGSSKSNIRSPTSTPAERTLDIGHWTSDETTPHPGPHTLHPALRLGLLCVKGLREDAGRAIVRAREERPFTSIDDLHQRVPELRKDELRKLAAVGALNQIKGVGYRVSGVGEDKGVGGCVSDVRSKPAELGTFVSLHEAGVYSPNNILKSDEISRPDAKTQRTANASGSNNEHRTRRTPHPTSNTPHPTPHRRDALWQVERVARDAGPLYETLEEVSGSPLRAMDLNERLNADLRGTGITIGRHPMAHQRAWLDTMKVTPAGQLKNLRNGMWVKVAGWVIVRQRPGTAKGFVFLSMEDETGISNIIVTPQLFETYRLALVNYPFLLIEGVLQHQDNVISVKARKIEPLQMKVADVGSHDFH
jgi:helix-hairpin-helix protein/OB-fold nucleic acid binding protein